MLSVEQYREIQNAYEDIRRRNRVLTEEKRGEIYRRAEGLAEAENEMVSLGVRAAKAEMAGDEALAEQLRDEARRMQETFEDILAKAGYGPEDLEPVYTCPACKDTGYIRREDGTQEKCECFRRRELEILYEKSHLKDLVKYQNFGTLTYDGLEGEDLDHFRTAVKICRDFAENFDTNFQNLLFYGTVGTGKSFLSCCIAAELLKTAHSVVYLSSQRFFDSLAAITFDRDWRTDKDAQLEELTSCDLLVLDDLGTELTNGFVATQLFACINERALLRRHTIISTNLGLEDLRERYSDRVLSRLAGGYTFLKLTGPDFRLIGK